jgi:hypothetical protein
MRLTVFIAALLVSGAAVAEEPGFLFDALRLPKHHMAWERLVKTVEPTPDWLLHFERNFDGAAGEMKAVTIDGKPFKLSYVCKPEDCAGHRFAVLFENDGRVAFGALGGKDEPPAFFGKPSPAQQEALANALKPASTAAAPAAKEDAGAKAAQPQADATQKSN